MRNGFNTRKLLYLATLTAAGLVLHLVESWLPPILAFAPGTKVGLANVVTLFALIVFGWREGLIVLLARCLLGSLFSGNIGMGLTYSLSGGLAAYLVMAALYRFLFPRVSLAAVSIAGACAHNLAQLLVASLFVGEIRVFYLLPFTAAASFAAGLFIGLAVHYTVKALPVKYLSLKA
ncbi:MAG: Gx transporter family protein [Clostridiales bacterium]|jgi:heptaprenyl diphosphate synthase|nr:Gx transporter family protein [Clostridiales bacterium]